MSLNPRLQSLISEREKRAKNRRELLNEPVIRDMARNSVLAYANAIEIPGKPATDDPDEALFLPVETTIAHHHRLILEAFERTANTPHGRLMLFLPPGSAKSTYGSVVFPSRFLGQKPGRKMILASYGDDLARKMGRRTRQICRSSRFRGIWGCELSKESSAAEQWALTNGSEYMSCGLVSGITGNRAHGVVIDDPVKGREAANSKTIRDKTWDAYQDDLLTRLVPGGWLAIIQTRWHEDDLAGRILPMDWAGESGRIDGRDGNTWEVLCVQAKCESGKNDPLGRKPGEYLWPEWFDRQHWAQFEGNARAWASLFQQIPTPAEGDLFRPDNMPIMTEIPHGTGRWVRGWDLGASVNGDPTAGGKIGIMPDGRYLIADIVRMAGPPHEVEAVLKNTAARDGATVLQSIPQDPGQAGKSQIAYLARLLAGHRVTSGPETGDKITRAEPLAAQVNVGNVAMLRAPWNDALIAEMRAFPNAAHDDQIDALSRAFNELIGTIGGSRLNAIMGG